MMAVISASLIPSGNSAGLFVSTITTGAPASTPSMMSGLSRFQRFRTNAASVLGSPNSFGAAAMPFTSFKYHDHTMGEPVESVSGDLWPKICSVIAVVLCKIIFCAPYTRRSDDCHLVRGAQEHGFFRRRHVRLIGISTHREITQRIHRFDTVFHNISGHRPTRAFCIKTNDAGSLFMFLVKLRRDYAQ